MVKILIVRIRRFAQRLCRLVAIAHAMHASHSQLLLHFLHERFAAYGKSLRPTLFTLRALRKCILNAVAMWNLQLFHASKATQACQLLLIDQRAASWRYLDLVEASMLPLLGMRDQSRADHVEIDVHQAAVQMLIGLNRRRVIAGAAMGEAAAARVVTGPTVECAGPRACARYRT